MTHPNKVKGDKFERDVRDYLRGKGVLVDRIPAGSTDDLGDLWLPHPGPVVQCKNHARIDLAVDSSTKRASAATDLLVSWMISPRTSHSQISGPRAAGEHRRA